MLPTFRAWKLQIEMDTLSVHLHVTFLVCLVSTIIKITVKSTRLWRQLFVTFSRFQILNMMSSKFSVVIKCFLTLLTAVLFSFVMNNIYVLGHVAEGLLAIGANVFVVRHRD